MDDERAHLEEVDGDDGCIEVAEILAEMREDDEDGQP